MFTHHNEQKKFLQFPERFLLVFGIIVGLCYCLFIPYGAGFDEEAHMVRVFDISGLHFIPNISPYTPSEFYTLSYQRRNYQSPAFDQFSPENLNQKINWNNMAGGYTISTHSPANYFLQAIVAGIGLRLFDAPILPVVFFIRLIGFAFYLFCCYWTIRLLPFGKWLFVVMAFLPMALFQQATITADGFTIAISFLFIGKVLNVYFRDEKKITFGDSLVLAIIAVLVGGAKSGTIVLLFLLLLLIHHRHESKAGRWVILGGVLLSIFVSLGWMLGVLFHQRILSGSHTFSSQVGLIVKNIPEFVTGYFAGIFASIPNYYKNWLASYGYWVGKVPTLVFILYPLAIIAALFCEQKAKPSGWKGRVFILLVGVVGLVSVTMYNFVGFYEPGRVMIDIVGRYFIPFMPLLFLSVSGLFEVKPNTQRVVQIVALVLTIGTVAFYSFGIYRTYYTKCVYPLSADHTCVLPVYKNLDIKNPPAAGLDKSTVIRQSIVPECNQITAVQFMAGIVNPASADEGELMITDNAGKQIAEQRFSISSINNGRFIKIPVSLDDFENKTIWLNLSLPESDSSNAAINFYERAGAAIYPQGELLVNGIKQDADLVFQYTCLNP